MERFAVHAHDDPAVGHEAVLRLELPHVLELALGHGATVKALGAPRLPVPSLAAAAAKRAQPGTPCTPHLHTMLEKLTSDASNNHLHTCTSTSPYFRNAAGMSLLVVLRSHVACIYIFLPFITLFFFFFFFIRTSGMSYMYKHFSLLQEHRGNVLHVQALLGTSGTPRECLTCTSTSRYFRNAAGMSYICTYKHFSVLQEHRGNVLHVQALLGTSGTPRECLTFVHTSTFQYFRNTAGMSYMYKHFSVLQEHRGNVLHLYIQALFSTSGTPRECLTCTSTSRYFRNAAGMSLLVVLGSHVACIYSFLLLLFFFFYSFFLSLFYLGKFFVVVGTVVYFLVGSLWGKWRRGTGCRQWKRPNHPSAVAAGTVGLHAKKKKKEVHTAQKASLSHRGQRGKIDLLSGACRHTPRYVDMYNTHCWRARGRAGSIALFLADFYRCRQRLSGLISQSKQSHARNRLTRGCRRCWHRVWKVDLTSNATGSSFRPSTIWKRTTLIKHTQRERG